jgi:uncharacterized membrane protein YdbT with pleckstrin-like domain
MGSMKDTLMKDEKVVHESKQHWIVFVLPALILAWGISLGATAGSWFLAVIAGAWLMLKIMDYRGAEFVVTNKRVIIKTGWASKNVCDMPLAKVETVHVNQSMSGFGTLTLVGAGGTAARIRKLVRPMDFKNAIQEQSAK